MGLMQASQATELRKVRCAGGIVANGGMVCLVTQGTGKYRTWVLPKGPLLEDETSLEAAWRKARDETGMRAPSSMSRLCTLDRVGKDDGERVLKSIEFFLFRTDGRFTLASNERHSAGWFLFRDAVDFLTYDAEKVFLLQNKGNIMAQERSGRFVTFKTHGYRTAVMWEERTNKFIAVCPEFGLAMQGDSLFKTIGEIKEAVKTCSLFESAGDKSAAEQYVASVPKAPAGERLSLGILKKILKGAGASQEEIRFHLEQHLKFLNGS